MRNLSTASIVLTVSLLCGAHAAWAGAGAQTDAATVPPIRVQQCSMAEQAGMVNAKIGLRLPATAGLTIVYTNDRDVAATDVRFRVHYHGQILTFVDRGTFAPNIKISREFDSFNAIFSGSSADCSVTSAAFADGTRWDAADMPPSPAPRR